MTNVFLIIQIVLAILIIVAVLLQAQGSGFGTVWSGGGETYHTRRGLEKVIFYFTMVAIVLFAAVSIAVVLV